MSTDSFAIGKALKTSENQKINPPVTLEIADDENGLKGWLAIDSMINNHCCGGLRMSPDISALEMADLAKAMTLKFGFLGLPHGGAKAGIICDEGASRDYKLHLLETFFLKMQDFIGEYVYDPHPDMGTNKQDICAMLEIVGTPVAKKALVTERSGWYTSLTVISSASIAATYKGLDLSKSTVAVEGFGKVGSSVAMGLHQLGSKVVAISTSQGAIYSPNGLDISKLINMSRRLGSGVVNKYKDGERIDKDKLLELNVNILSPCATGYTISVKNASRIKAQLICPGANFPITEEAEEFFFNRGILCVPYFVSNSGGALGGTMEFAGLSLTTIEEFVNHVFSKQVSAILKRSQAKGIYPLKVAEDIARDRFTHIKAIAETKSIGNNVFGFALGLYRKGLIPRIFSKILSKRYFQERIEGRF